MDGRCRHELLLDRLALQLTAHRLDPVSLLPGTLEPFGLHGHNELHGHRRDYRVPVYVAGYVPPGSINDAWEPAIAYVSAADDNRGLSYEDPKGSWIRAPGATSTLLFEVTTSGTSGGTIPSFPVSMSEWAPGFTYDALQWLAPPTSLLVFEPTTPGTSGDREPTWPLEAAVVVSAINGTAVWTARESMAIPDNTVIWTGRNAFEMPLGIRKAALLLARVLEILDADGTCKDEDKKMKAIVGLLRGSC